MTPSSPHDRGFTPGSAPPPRPQTAPAGTPRSAPPGPGSAKVSCTFECKPDLLARFFDMADRLACPVDELISEAMSRYLRDQSGRRPVPSLPGPGGHVSVPPPLAAASLPSPHGAARSLSPAAGLPARPLPPPPLAPPPRHGPLPVAPLGGGPVQSSSPVPPPAPAQVPLPPQPALPPLGPIPPGFAIAAPPTAVATPNVAAALAGLPGGRPVAPPPRPVAPSLASGAAPLENAAEPAVPLVKTAGAPKPAGAGRQLVLSYNGQDYPVAKDRFVIGRTRKNNDLAIPDPNVSRQHALVEFVDGVPFLVDLGSTNGVQHAGQDILRKRIDDGDVYMVGGHQVAFSYR